MSVGSYPKMDHYLIFKRKDVDTVEVSNEIYEILYKSQLANIAYNIELIPGYNIIGTSPTTILDFGLPLKILKTFDQSTLIYKLYSETTINICRMVYEQYADYMVIIKFLLRNGIIWKNFVVTMGF